MADEGGFTAVIHFHGMGSQRRYEESSRLIDSIDSYLANSYHLRGKARGILREIAPLTEEHLDHSGEVVDYIRTRHVTPSEADHGSSEVRFYEAYWAPIMAGTRSWRDVASWAGRQVLRPFYTLSTPWRERQRLRRAALANLYDHPKKWPAGTREKDFSKLLRAYSAFNNLSVKRQKIRPDFKGFLGYLAGQFAETKGKPVTTERLLNLAGVWKREYKSREYISFFVLITILLALGLALGGLVWGIFHGLLLIARLLPALHLPNELNAMALKQITPSLTNAIALTPVILLALGMGRFLSRSMGDVQVWATMDETETDYQKRRKVLDSCTRLVAHVLKHPKCKRVAIVSHSLGTSVAHDTLLALRWRNMANSNGDPIKGPVPLSKIRHFVTMGSPIDKIQYFFESRRSKSHRYMRVFESVRGDISTEPFSRNGKPYIHWVNYWDEADIISGPLQSDTGPKRIDFRVDNVHVCNLRFPDPGASHNAYFENRNVISGLFDIAYHGDYNYGDLIWKKGTKGLNYDQMALRPGDALGQYRNWHVIALCLPWVTLSGLIALSTGAPEIGHGLLWVVGIVAIAMSGAWAIDRWRGNRSPL